MANIIRFLKNWQQAHAALEQDVQWLGQAGWTIPMQLDPNIVRRLRYSPGNLDSAFVRYYTSNRNAKLEALWKRLLESKGLRPWRLILKESIDCYRDRRYAIVIPALLLVLEGAIAKGAGHFREKKLSPQHSAEKKRATIEEGMRRLVWTSVQAFAGLVFQHAPFDEPCPRVLNRHWIMHGRAGTKWALRREAIRLYHALDTVSVLVDRIPRIKINSESSIAK